MELWEMMILSIAIAIIAPIAFSVFWFCKKHEEKKISSTNFVRTRPPKLLSGFFLGFALLVLLGGIAGIIVCCITDSENTTVSQIVTLSICIVAFSGLGFFGYAYVAFNYVVANDEGILAYRLFRKKKFYRYEDIDSFQDTISMGMAGGLTGYDKNNKKIFAIEAVHVGSSNVAQMLREHGVVERFNNTLN
ncbi:MAG: hypothetical protein K2M64_03695 [Clostridia bacterium]|nr:hypothetical protein [Clostridia bacterium]